ncbi:PAS domain S-box protein [Pelolinea submarina]|uniref:PAS domain S-box protein n=1 Tax=Pelolinea submarina TaxID=913107 RepID=UPI000F81C4ED|nr:PAS domain S-box protein [Pelolinea submarina]
MADRLSYVVEHNQVEKTLREKEELFYSMFVQHKAIMLLIEPKTGQIIDANNEAVLFYGYPKTKLTSMKIQEINCLPDEAVEKERNLALKRNKNFFTFEHKLSNNEIRLVEVHSTPISINGQDILFSIIHDITERRQFEERIQDLSRFPDENPNPVLRFSKEGTLLYASKSSAALLREWGRSVGEKAPKEWIENIFNSFQSDAYLEIETSCEDRLLSFILAPIHEKGYVNAYGRDVTEQKQKEKALLESEERFRSVLFSTPDFILLVDIDLKIEFVNRPLPDLKVDDLIGRNIVDFVEEEKQSEIKKILKNVLKTGFDAIYETQYRTASGLTFCYETKAVRRTINKTVVGLVLNTRDITSRKQIEETLRKNQKRYEEAQRIGLVGNWEFYPETAEFWGSEEARRIYGFSMDQEKFTTENVEGCIPERERVHQALIDLIEHNKKYDLIFDILTFDKEIRKTIHSIAEVERDAQGKPVKVTGVISDITKQQITEKALLESEKRHRTYIEHAPLGIFIANDKGEYIDVNPNACKLLGYSRDELLALSIPDISDEEDSIENFKHLKEVGRKSIETGLKKKDGSIINVRLDAVTIPNDQFLGFVTDITERKLSEEKLRQSEEQYRSVVEDSPGMICRFSADGTITFANYEYCKFFGKTLDQLIGANIQETIARQNRESIWSKIKSLTSESPIQVLENENINHAGEIRHLRWTNRALFNKKGHLLNYQSFGEDITERMRTDKLLKVLNKASTTMSTALAHKDIFDAIAKELRKLGISCYIMESDETKQYLYLNFLSYDSAALKTAIKLTGIKPENYSVKIDSVDFIREVIREKKTYFSEKTDQLIGQMLPKAIRKLSPQIEKILHITTSISVPLINEEQVIGIFSMQSGNLTLEDVPAATAFADQLSAAWKKVELVQNLTKAVEGTINTIAATVEVRDPYTAGHQKRVAALAAVIAVELGLARDQVEGIRMAATIHDLGKVRVPAEILSKPGRITDLEYEMIKTHSRIGYDLLKNIDFPWPLAKIVLQHHERINGSGYPQGLKGDEIMLEARILGVADVVEAMASHRPYRPALGIDLALNEITNEQGILFDSDVVNACLKSFKNGFKFPSELTTEDLYIT